MAGESRQPDPEIERQLDVLMSGTDYGDAGLQQAMRKELAGMLREGRPLRVYLGVDPTSPNIHLGHGVVINKLAQFQELGHHVTFLIGDFTALIGDPSGRSKTRPALTTEEVTAHAETYAEQAFRIIDRESAELRYNSEWLSNLPFTDVIQLTGSMTLAQVLVREDFRKRFDDGAPIHLHEFLYALAQAEDACRLEADVQVGGRDQLFNLLAGRDVMKARGLRPQVAITLPLLTGTDGQLKMSKSYGNDIGITSDPADMYGKVMSLPDGSMADYYVLASGLPAAEAAERSRAVKDSTVHPRDAKMHLARSIVQRWHGEDEANRAEAAFVAQFQKHETPDDLPTLAIPAAKTVLDLVMATGTVKSKSEGRRLIHAGAVALDGERLEQWDATPPDLQPGAVLKLGKRRLFRLES